ncbi:MAG TPA: hypothetical protein VMU85_21560 [Stellaceae bacterium]|nr:hypothetical protein [Stellaceae bacterium]
MSKSLLRRLGWQEASEEVKPGDSYRRSRGDKLTETVTVVDLRSDPAGIPHVRFKVAFERPDVGRFEGGCRILALRSFIDAYRERISQTPASAA